MEKFINGQITEQFVKKLSKFELINSESNFITVNYDSKRLCSYNVTKNQITQYSENKNQLFDFELMKFFVQEFLGLEIKSTISTATIIKILGVRH